MAALVNVVKFTPTAGGTSDWTYSSAVTGYQSPAAAGAVDTKVYRYRAESSDLSQWEVGYGAASSTATVFARTTVLANSSGTTSKISFSSAPTVGLVLLAEDVREKLDAARTYYVRSDGSNSNSGLANTSGGAFLTLQKAYDVITANLDLGGQTVTVQIADATYTGALAITQPWTGGGAVTFQGNSGTPANVVLSTTSAHAISTTGILPGTLTIKDMKIQTTTSGSCINHQAAGLIQFTNLNFGAVAGDAHINAVGSGVNVECTGNYAISGGGFAHVIASRPANVSIRSKTITITGTPAFSGAFAFASQGGIIAIDTNTFSGSATGSRYTAQDGGDIYVAGAATTYLPGNAAGSGTNYGTTPFGLYR